mgnify:CR=1 FL=1
MVRVILGFLSIFLLGNDSFCSGKNRDFQNVTRNLVTGAGRQLIRYEPVKSDENRTLYRVTHVDIEGPFAKKFKVGQILSDLENDQEYATIP